MSEDRVMDLAAAVAVAVRMVNRQGRAVDLAEVLGLLGQRPAPAAAKPADAPGGAEAKPADAPDLAAQVTAVLAALPGFSSFPGLSGQPLFHDPSILSATYARIMDRRKAPPVLVAEEVRLNSRDYPRPLPLEIFEAPPFSLAQEVILATLGDMAASPEYADIAVTTAPGGTVFLFSTRHLDPGYAEFLAERAEGMAANP